MRWRLALNQLDFQTPIITESHFVAPICPAHLAAARVYIHSRRAGHQCRAQGDNDPVDVVEIGEQRLDMGGVYAVKPLAVLAMIDDGELDWKIVAIHADDPRAASVNDVEDVERCDSQDTLLLYLNLSSHLRPYFHSPHLDLPLSLSLDHGKLVLGSCTVN